MLYSQNMLTKKKIGKFLTSSAVHLATVQRARHLFIVSSEAGKNKTS